MYSGSGSRAMIVMFLLHISLLSMPEYDVHEYHRIGFGWLGNKENLDTVICVDDI